MKIGLIPLDERPANTRYPAMIAAIAGAQLALPPPEILSALRRPADCAGLAQWLEHAAPTLDGLIVSCEMLGYGSLIASRTSDESAGAILARLDVLRAIRQQFPSLPIFGFSLLTRVSQANDATEEPAYWATYGAQLYQLSELLDRQQQGQPVGSGIDMLLATIPHAQRNDFLRRRLRNHAVNLALLQLLAEDVFDLLVLSSDDTSPFGLPTREKHWLRAWADMLALGERLLMYPGADEVGCALLARLLNTHASLTPTFAVAYAPPEAATNIAAFEDGPIQVTVERQICVVGGQLAAQDADVWVGVNAPVTRRSEWLPAFADAERTTRLAALQALVDMAVQRQAQGTPVVIADVAYPNGADPALVDLLWAQVQLPTLAAYGAWNTAGNTIGTALAQACAARMIASATQRQAHERFLLHRLLEDWGYQQLVRAEIRDWLRTEHGRAEPNAATLAATQALIAQRLDGLIAQLPGFAHRYRLAPGSVRLPWARTFEVDFELEKRG